MSNDGAILNGLLVRLLAQLLLGLYSITASAQHLDGGEMIRLMH